MFVAESHASGACNDAQSAESLVACNQILDDLQFESVVKIHFLKDLLAFLHLIIINKTDVHIVGPMSGRDVDYITGNLDFFKKVIFIFGKVVIGNVHATLKIVKSEFVLGCANEGQAFNIKIVMLLKGKRYDEIITVFGGYE